jgi:hypothetical protein
MNESQTCPAEAVAQAARREHGAPPHARWLGPTSVRVAWLALSLAVLLPPRGVGLSLCWMRRAGVPCPGCGLTRSLSCAVRGSFLESWHFHPFGLLILGLFLAVAAASLVRGPARERLHASLDAHHRLLDAAFLGFVIAFAAFGVLRAVLQLAGVCQFGV